MPSIEIRQGRAEDREAILAFCVHTWEWGDYIELVWDEWLHDPQGQLFVATVDGQPVGMGHMRMLNAMEAWLEGLRIDPAYRQQGLAMAINDVMLAEAMRRGATLVRLVTEATNAAVVRMMKHVLMRQVGTFVRFRGLPMTTAPKRQYGLEIPQLATMNDLDEIIDYLNASNIFPVVGGLYYFGLTAYSISSELLQLKLLTQQVYVLRRWGRLDGLAFAEPRQGRLDKHLFVGYIDGSPEAISLIAYALRRIVVDMGLESVGAHVPDLILVRDAFVGAEYQWDKVFYTFERELR